MTVYRLGPQLAFPDPREAEPSGLLAVGGDLAPERLLLAYRSGIFPWYDEAPILWYAPDPRAALAPGRLHVSRRLARTLRQGRFEVRLDTAFGDVIRACAALPRSGQVGTWIHADMIEAYERLHALGFAHSAETWRDGRLVGGLYGVSLGSAFFGESMFHRERDASKVALATLCEALVGWGFDLFDAQLPNPHLASLGFERWPRERFQERLEESASRPTRRGPWRLDAGAPGRGAA